MGFWPLISFLQEKHPKKPILGLKTPIFTKNSQFFKPTFIFKSGQKPTKSGQKTAIFLKIQ